MSKSLLINNLTATVVLSAILIISGGCATSGPKVTKQRLFFPKPPASPRIEFIDAYSSSNDFPVSKFKAFLDGILGGKPPERFARPFDIASNGKGKIYISDIYRPGLYIYDLNARSIRVIEAKLLGYIPRGLAIDKNGNIYISDTRGNVVYVYDKRESPLYTISANLDWPTGVAVDERREKIYVANSHGHNITVYDMKGRYLSTIGKRGSANGELNYPVDVETSKEGKIIVADSMNARVQVFSSDGNFESTFGTRGDNPSNFGNIKGVAIDSDDNIYVTDGSLNNVKIYNIRGDYLMTLGGGYVVSGGKIAPGGFGLPSGIDIDENNGIHIADQVNNLFQIFQYMDEGYLKRYPILQ